MNATTDIPHNGTATSTAAADSMEPHVPRCERMVLQALATLSGGTCDEVELFTLLPHQNASARINALAKRGDIFDSGQTRKTRSGRAAIVWCVTPRQTSFSL